VKSSSQGLAKILLGALAVCLVGASIAAPAMPPHLGPSGQSEYREYLEAANHSAFAIAPGGAWGWVSAEPSAAAAEEKALGICQGQTSQRCVSYAIDEKLVFDALAWSRLWGPYATATQAKRATVGRELGQRLADLTFVDAKGGRRSLSALRGKVVLVHLWGAWCPPCRQEMPELQKLHKSLESKSDIVFVVMQAREKFDVSRQWAARQGIDLPLADSGSAGDDDTQFQLAGGARIKDREIASRFPTTYVLDKRGLVVFAHVGPVHDWLQYEVFLRDVAERSGR
jgi:thiol-disulfide isomerase/thioredoxin